MKQASMLTSHLKGLYKGNLLLAHGAKVHSLYPLYVALKEHGLSLVDIFCVILWHERLGCLNKSSITYLSKAEYTPKLSFFDHQFYKHC